jgi:hypothetical protein
MSDLCIRLIATRKKEENKMPVSAEYIQNLVAELNADKEELERKPEFIEREPVMVVYSVGQNWAEPYRHFAKREDAQAYFDAGDWDYIDETKIY